MDDPLRKLSIQYFGGFVEKRQMEFPLFPQLSNDQAGRGASGEIMAVNKTLGIIYHLYGRRWGGGNQNKNAHNIQNTAYMF